MHSLKVDSYNRVLFVALEERAAAIPSDERARLSEPEAQYAIYMMEKYDDDYKVRCTILQEKKELIHWLSLFDREQGAAQLACEWLHSLEQGWAS